MRAPFSRTLGDLLGEQAERHRDRLAVISGDKQVTYDQLHARAGQVAGALHAAGLRRGERIALLVDNRVEWLEIVFGAALLGVTAVPLSTWSRQREIDFLLRDARARLLFTMHRLSEQDYAADLAALIPALGNAPPGAWRSDAYPELEAVVMIGGNTLSGTLPYTGFVAHHAAPAALPPGEGARPHDTAAVLYTSGSTAYPKAVPQIHADMIENGFNIGERQGLEPGDRVLLSPPLFWSYGLANALCASFTHGATLVLQSRFDAGEALDLIERYACTALYTLPGMTSAMLAHPAFDRARTTSLRKGLTIGSPQDVMTVAEALGASHICNIYGQTETYGNCAVTWHHWPLERRARVQGPPLPGVSVRIVHPEHGTPMAPGEVGLMEVRGYVTPGYEGASAAQNASAFTADGFFRTGDLGRLTAEGDVQFVGRDSEIIKRAGINIAPAEIEEILRQHPAVAQAGVAGAPDADKGEIIVAFVVTHRDAQVEGEALRRHCRTLAASYKTPDRIEFRDALPATPTGKLMRRELKRMADAIAQQPTGVP